METFKYLNGLATECSKLIQSFSVKVKGGSQRGLQYKHVRKTDPMEELIKNVAPEVWKRAHPDKES